MDELKSKVLCVTYYYDGVNRLNTSLPDLTVGNGLCAVPGVTMTNLVRIIVGGRLAGDSERHAGRSLRSLTKAVRKSTILKIRRECIYAFRKATIWERYVERKTVKILPNTIQRALVSVRRCGTENCVPYENVVTFPIQRTAVVTHRCGTDKSVPYERLVR